jgi:hypothetical protein
MNDHTKMEPKPVAGQDTPAADDIVTPCAGRCGRWMVQQRPSHVRGGRALNPKTGEMRDWSPTPKWVEPEADRLARGDSSCLSCGPVEASDEERAEREVERQHVSALRNYS